MTNIKTKIKESAKKAVAFLFLSLSFLYLKLKKPKLIVVVGNVGKTSTKDTIYHLLKSAGRGVIASKKSFNSEIGVPLSIFELENPYKSLLLWLKNFALALVKFFTKAPEFIVLELGADKPGDIKMFCKFLPEVYAFVVVAIPENPVHLSNFKNKQELIDEKLSIIKCKKAKYLIYENDSAYAKLAKDFTDAETISYGFSKSSDCKVLDINFECKDGLANSMNISIECKADKYNLTLKDNIGYGQVYPILSALSLAQIFALQKFAQYLENKPATAGRMRLLPAKKGAVMIDDSYNASFSATLAGLDTLHAFRCVRGSKIAVLGDMLEAGEKEEELHKKVLARALEVSDFVFTLGPRFSKASSAFNSPSLYSFKEGEHEKLLAELDKIYNSKDLIYIKGSQGMRMEKIAKALLSEKLVSEEVLVRQDDFWLNK